VFATEPVDPDDPLLRLDNVIVTPHVVWYTRDTMGRYLTHAIDNCQPVAGRTGSGQRRQREAACPSNRC
jgi:phosphoglycerate dehydrogenase-like enzyme